MLPVAPLMIEHRLIERMIDLVRDRLEQFREERTADTGFIDDAVRFIRDFADRTHHGKEEGILFRELEKKPLSDEHRRTMNELAAEHRHARKMVADLMAANRRWAAGDRGALPDIIEPMKALVELYPGHIEKEDRHFFLPVMDYFPEPERDALLEESNDFDRRVVHELYREVVEKWQNQSGVEH